LSVGASGFRVANRRVALISNVASGDIVLASLNGVAIIGVASIAHSAFNGRLAAALNGIASGVRARGRLASCDGRVGATGAGIAKRLGTSISAGAG
jgi:hypothetical protein